MPDPDLPGQARRQGRVPHFFVAEDLGDRGDGRYLRHRRGAVGLSQAFYNYHIGKVAPPQARHLQCRGNLTLSNDYRQFRALHPVSA